MRRLVPWLLVALVGVGAIGAATIAIANKGRSLTPSQWVTQVFNATKEAGTAHITYSHVTKSTNPELQGAVVGHGVVDFADGTLHVTETDHQITLDSSEGQPAHLTPSTTTVETIVVDGSSYQSISIPGFGPESYRFIQLPATSASVSGLSLATTAGIAVNVLHGLYSVASVIDLGPAEINGVATTKYGVHYAPLRLCPPRQSPVVSTQRPTTLWVDGDGRLRRVRSTAFVSNRQPSGVKIPAAFQGIPAGPVTTVDMITFSQFGAPVHVVAPPTNAILPRGSVGTIVLKSDVCPSGMHGGPGR